MKTKNILTKALLSILVIVPFFISCNSSDDGDSGDGDGSVTSITITAAPNTITEGESVSFTVKDNLNNDVTANSSLSIGSLVISNPYTFNDEGTYDVVAAYNSLTSNVSISVGAVQANSITLSSSKTYMFTNESTQLTVMDDFGNDITSSSTITVNGTAITENPYTFGAPGDYVIQATNAALTSNEVNVSAFVEEAFSASGAPNSYTKKILISDFTGTWCGACPIAGEAIHDAKANNPNVIPVGYHDNDNMTNADAIAVDNFFGINSYPTVLINGAEGQWSWSSFPISELTPYLNATAPLGLGITAAVEGSKIVASVKVGYASNPGSVKLAIYVLEDGFVSSQANFYVSGHGNPWTDYVHDDILRKSYTSPLGDDISAGNVGAGGVYTRTVIENFPSSVVDGNNVRIVAFVSDSNNNVLNVQTVDLGETKDFD